MSDYSGFDAFCDEWEAAHPGEQIDYPTAFAQWAADESGRTIIGREVNGDGLAVALPSEPQEAPNA